MQITFGQWQTHSLEMLEIEYEQLKSYLNTNPTDILLLPEFPFDSWFCSLPTFQKERWDKSYRLHQEWIDRLDQLKVKQICGTRPYSENERHNVAWSYDLNSKELQDIHGKKYLPNEEGFWEANWYDPAEICFNPFEILENVIAGFMICTDLWFLNHARDYGQQGVDIILVPRSTEKATLDKWLVGGRAAAVLSGSYVISSNHFGIAEDSKTELGGMGYVIDPNGKIIGQSSENNPWMTVEIDIDLARKAKCQYPRYVDSTQYHYSI